MRSLKVVLLSLLLMTLAIAQGGAPASHNTAQPKSVSIPGFDITALDKTTDPCVDFYQFACGGWMAKNPVPSDQTRWGRFDELQERNYQVLRQILEDAGRPNPKRSAEEQKIGDYYAACMDQGVIEGLGTKPIQPEFDRIAKIQGRRDLIDAAAHFYALGVSSLFSFSSGPDMHDAGQTIAQLGDGGFSLPDRDYYLKDDPKSVETRAKYVQHVQKMFELAGDNARTAAAEAKSVMAVETELAKATMDRVIRRDPKNRDHKMTRQELEKIAPGFDFPRYFAAVSAPEFKTLNVANPDFLKRINAQLNLLPLADWKAYLKWRVLRDATPMLSSKLVDENFKFNGAYMNGQKELEPRWKRCVRSTDRALGEALGKLYVDKTFGVEGKQRTLKMVDAIEKAMGEDLKALPWMSDETRKQAFDKLHSLRNNIGYPDKWRDYSKVKIERGDALGNNLRASGFEVERQLNKIGKPVDRKEWGMTPPTVNAYYRSAMNDINFPAGILQPPFFDKALDDAVNYGAIGAVIGHELTHGFDDQGAKFDASGNLRDWWTPKDKVEFEKRTGCLAEQYSTYSPIPGVFLNGKLTLGENTADNGGVKLAFMALEDTIARKPKKRIDGFTPEQRFFLGNAQIWCQNVTPERSRVLAIVDPHSAGRFRVNGVVVNSAEFQKAFGCKAGQPMVSPKACRVW